MMITVFYDDDCPICQSEIAHLCQKCPDKINVIPVKMAIDELQQAGISQVDALTYLCIKDENEQFVTGIHAVRLLHQTTDTRIGKWLQLPIIKPISAWFYPIFVRHRYKIPPIIARWLFGQSNCNGGTCYLSPETRLSPNQSSDTKQP